MKLTTKGRYAVSAILDLAIHNKEQRVVLQDISDRCMVSLSYLEQLFSKMRQANIIDSTRGPGGGYRIVRPFNDITIAEIIKSVDESIETRSCEGRGGCAGKKAGQYCNTHALWEGLMVSMYSYLDKITLQDLYNDAILNTNNKILKQG